MATSSLFSSVSDAMRSPLMTTPFVLPRSAITTELLLSFTTAWKRLMLGSFRTRSLALPRPMVITGLLSSRMPLLPSGAEMIKRDILLNLPRARPFYFPSLAFQICQEGRERGPYFDSNCCRAYALKQNRYAQAAVVTVLCSNSLGLDFFVALSQSREPKAHLWLWC